MTAPRLRLLGGERRARMLACGVLLIAGLLGIIAGIRANEPTALEIRLGILMTVVAVRLLVSIRRRPCAAGAPDDGLGPDRSSPQGRLCGHRRGAADVLLAALLLLAGVMGLVAGTSPIASVSFILELVMVAASITVLLAEVHAFPEYVHDSRF